MITSSPQSPCSRQPDQDDSSHVYIRSRSNSMDLLQQQDSPVDIAPHSPSSPPSNTRKQQQSQHPTKNTPPNTNANTNKNTAFAGLNNQLDISTACHIDEGRDDARHTQLTQTSSTSMQVSDPIQHKMTSDTAHGQDDDNHSFHSIKQELCPQNASLHHAHMDSSHQTTILAAQQLRKPPSTANIESHAQQNSQRNFTQLEIKLHEVSRETQSHFSIALPHSPLNSLDISPDQTREKVHLNQHLFSQVSLTRPSSHPILIPSPPQSLFSSFSDPTTLMPSMQKIPQDSSSFTPLMLNVRQSKAGDPLGFSGISAAEFAEAKNSLPDQTTPQKVLFSSHSAILSRIHPEHFNSIDCHVHMSKVLLKRNRHKEALEILEPLPSYIHDWLNKRDENIALLNLQQLSDNLDDNVKSQLAQINSRPSFDSSPSIQSHLENQNNVISPESVIVLVCNLLSHILSLKGSCCKELKLIQDAVDVFEAALRINPDNILALHDYAILIYHNSHSRAMEAITLLRRAVYIAPHLVETRRSLASFLVDVGVRLKNAGLIQDSFKLYSEAIQIDPACDAAYYNTGVAFSDINQKDTALEYYAKTVNINPNHAEAFCNAGVIYKLLGNLPRAIEEYEKALIVRPNFDLAKSNLAIALCEAGTLTKASGNVKHAIKLYKRALLYLPTYPDAYYNLGVVYSEIHKVERAISNYELVVNFQPGHTEAWNNLGVLYKDLGNLEKSVCCYKQALSLNPRHHQTHNNIALIYTLAGDLDSARKHLQYAIQLEPNYVEAHNNLGVLLRDEGDIQNAINYYDMCLKINPNADMSAQNRLHALNYVDYLTPNQIFEEHKKWGDSFLHRVETEMKAYVDTVEDVAYIQNNKKQAAEKPTRGRGCPLRVGYISPDFFTHSVSYFIDVMLAKHRNSYIDVFVYSNVNKADSKTEMFKNYPNVKMTWREITSMGAVLVAKKIMEDDIDILVELAGHTAGNRLDVMALKPAPVQVTWIGYPNTTGLSTIDYRITDELADDVNTTQKYTEKLLRIPNVFLCYTPSHQSLPVIYPPPCLMNGRIVTFGSFNILAKMQPRAEALWIRILKSVPNSRLLLKAKCFASAERRLRMEKQFEAAGISRNRLDLVPLVPSTRSHMESYSNLDIALDPFPYAGTTTTCEALYMGVPVVTLGVTSEKGFHAQNVGVTLLKAIGHEELIAFNEDDYLKIAVDLASKPERLQEMRFKIREDMMRSPLGDGERFVKNVEDAYYRIWEEKGGKVQDYPFDGET